MKVAYIPYTKHDLWCQGAGKTSLFKAILNKGRKSTPTDGENLQPEADVQEGIASGLCYMDSSGVNLQVGFSRKWVS